MLAQLPVIRPARALPPLYLLAAALAATHPPLAAAQEPTVTDSIPAAREAPAPADTGRGGEPGAVADSTPAGEAAADSLPPGDVAADSMPADTAAGGDLLPADGAGAADSLAPDSAAAVDSLELLKEEIRRARERLEVTRRTLQTIPAEDRLRRSPRGAVLRAFALPGWGQFYTGHTFRGFMYAGAEVGFAVAGFLEQQAVNDQKDENSRARLEFVAEEQAAHPDSVFSRADTLALFDRFDLTPVGAQLQFTLESKQKQREDYFTYAIFSVLFAAIDAFVSAQLQPFEEADLDVRPAGGGWEVGLRLGVGSSGGRPPPGERKAGRR